MILPKPRALDWWFYGGVAFAYAAFAVIYDPIMSIPLVAFGTLIALVTGGGLVGRVVVQPSAATATLTTLAVGVFAVAYLTAWPARNAVADFQFARRRAILEAVVQEALRYPQIRSISAGTRYYKDVNRIQVRDLGPPTPPVREPAGPTDARPVNEVLQQEGISRAAYDAIRQGLLQAGYLNVAVWPEYVIFVEDGLVSSEYGVLWVRPGYPPPRVGEPEEKGRPYFTGFRPLGGHWFAFGAT